MPRLPSSAIHLGASHSNPKSLDIGKRVGELHREQERKMVGYNRQKSIWADKRLKIVMPKAIHF